MLGLRFGEQSSGISGKRGFGSLPRAVSARGDDDQELNRPILVVWRVL